MEIPEHNKIENNSPTNESHNFSLYLSGYIEMQRRVQAARKKKVPSIFNSFRGDANFPARNCLNLPHSPLLYFLRGGREDIKVLEIFTELFTNCVKLTLFGQQLVDITFNKLPLFIKSKTQTVFHTHKEN